MATTASEPTSEQAVRALLNRLAEAWEQGDASAYAELFTEEADYVIFDGTHLHGRRAIAEAHRPLFQRFLRGSRLTWQMVTVRFVRPDTALVCSRGAVLTRRDGAPKKSRTSTQTLVAVEQAGEWRVTAFQNTRYQPFHQTALGRLLHAFGVDTGAAPDAASDASRSLPERATSQ